MNMEETIKKKSGIAPESVEKIRSLVDEFANEHLKHLIVSNPVNREGVQKVRIRPVLLKGELTMQAEEFIGTQAFHKNLKPGELAEYLIGLFSGVLRQAQVSSALGEATVLVSKSGTVTVKIRRNSTAKQAYVQIQPNSLGSSEKQMNLGGNPLNAVLDHNRKKRYLLPEGVPVPFLVDLGVMTEKGAIVKSRYDKFRQINRFLEFIEDILPELSKERENTIIDFGCGKSYLTFAMYYYLHEVQGYPIRVIGLDLKKTVIEHCNQLAERYGYDKLKFLCGDIASYEGVNQVDMVVTLHACDTATDFALAKAVRWGAKVILSVPCCQHELNRQMKNELLKPVLGYGLIKERMAALYTDALRAELLENQGYRTQILEFIDMEHTPKNILIRAVRSGRKKNNRAEIEAICEEFSLKPTLAQLLWE